MHSYYFSRGLDVVELLAKQFRDREWYIPNLICDEVLDKIFEHVDNYRYYNVNDANLSWSVDITTNRPKVVYTIAYFGKELVLGSESPPNAITIRDSVWMPHPFSPVENHQIWFNSLRKIIRGATGASVVSPFRLRGCNEVPNIFQHPSLYWDEINKRWDNFFALREFFTPEHQISYSPEFPTVFPVRLKNREKVLSQIETPLPGMWKNKYRMVNPLYRELTFIPVDSRFTPESVIEIAKQMVALDK